MWYNIIIGSILLWCLAFLSRCSNQMIMISDLGIFTLFSNSVSSPFIYSKILIRNNSCLQFQIHKQHIFERRKILQRMRFFFKGFLFKSNLKTELLFQISTMILIHFEQSQLHFGIIAISKWKKCRYLWSNTYES